MATRANIKIVDKNRNGKTTILYHHWDGYPEYLGEMLNEFVHRLNERSSFFDNTTMANHLIKRGLKIYGPDKKLVKHDKWFELTDGIHGDIEYLYTITIENELVVKMRGLDRYSVSCQSYDWDWKTGKTVIADVQIPDSLNDECQVQLIDDDDE